MTDFELIKMPFDQESVVTWSLSNAIAQDWPVVYLLSDDKSVYVGETKSATKRFHQHLAHEKKKHLSQVGIILNDKFNRSVCTDLESNLISLFSADGKHKVLNANAGMSNGNYYQRNEYRESFNEIFDILVKDGILSRPVSEIINSNLFKFSPFKALNFDQEIALSEILKRLSIDAETGQGSQLIVQGEPGTGKTIVAIYLIKLIRDIAQISHDDLSDMDSIFSDFFSSEYAAVFENMKIALVVPQQSLRETIEKVFAQTPCLEKSMVLTPFDVAKSDMHFDLLIVDEAHRLGQRANQSSAMLNKQFTEANIKLFGIDDKSKTQLDWIEAKSTHQILLLDPEQSVKPGDLPLGITNQIINTATSESKLFKLVSQMRIKGGNDYLDFVNKLFAETPAPKKDFNGYDLRFYDDFESMRNEILQLNEEFGLSRLLAGFAWEYKSKKKPELFDIDIDGHQLRWNQTVKDWVNSLNSANEVGSIHTIQGYDLNYAGVIIGNDLGYDPILKKLVFRRENYFDIKGKENNKVLGIEYSDEDILKYVVNIYRVLLTRGIKGTFIYVCDPELRKIIMSRITNTNLKQ
jgi:DUF2075 family protein/ABC-type dipeptide/oligopeptide/nickel transport system ATPase subunit